MPTWIKNPPKQLIFSVLCLVTAVALIIDRIATEHYGWAAMWIVVGLIHAWIALDELLELFKKRGM